MNSPDIMPPDPNTAQADFVKAIRHRLVDLDWTDAQLCEQAGVSRSHWSDIRNGKRGMHFDTAARIAEAVGIKLTLMQPLTFS